MPEFCHISRNQGPVYNLSREIRKPFLMIKTFRIRVNLGKFREHFFRYLQGLITTSYKTIKSQNLLFYGGCWGRWGEGLRLSFERSRGGRGLLKLNKYEQEWGSIFRAFCDEIITECPL